MTTRSSLPPPYSTAPFTTRDALARGVPAGRLRSLDLNPAYRGIRLHAFTPVTLEQLCGARSLLFPSDAFLSGVTAAVLHGVPLPLHLEQSRVIHVTVPEGRRALSGRGVTGHAARVAIADVVDLRGLRVSSATRTWCELGAALSVADLVAAGDFLVHRDLAHTTIAALHAAVLEYPGRRGAGRLTAALPMLDDNTASRRESMLRVLAINQGFSAFVMNMKIRTTGGYTYYGDLTFANERVIVEYQSEYHFDPKQQRKDMTRRSRLEADGWAVMFINADDLDNPRELAARIRAVMAIHSRRRAGVRPS